MKRKKAKRRSGPGLESWGKCQRCGLHQWRRSVVIGNGKLPCDMLIIGEGPGKAENLVGLPFVGPAGSFQRKVIAKAFSMSRMKAEPFPSHFLTNLVACRPCDSKMGPNRPPTAEEMDKCLNRVLQIYRLAKPRVIVLVGSLAKSQLQGIIPEAKATLHPSFLLKQGAEASPFIVQYLRQWIDIFDFLYRMNAKGVLER